MCESRLKRGKPVSREVHLTRREMRNALAGGRTHSKRSIQDRFGGNL